MGSGCCAPFANTYARSALIPPHPHREREIGDVRQSRTRRVVDLVGLGTPGHDDAALQFVVLHHVPKPLQMASRNHYIVARAHGYTVGELWLLPHLHKEVPSPVTASDGYADGSSLSPRRRRFELQLCQRRQLAGPMVYSALAERKNEEPMD